MMIRSTPCFEEEPCARDAVAADHGRRGGGEQQRLVADGRRVVLAEVDEERPLGRAAIAAGEVARLEAAPLGDPRQRQAGRRLARAADDEIADADHRRRRPEARLPSHPPGRDLAVELRRRPEHQRGGAPLRPPPEPRRRAQGALAAGWRPAGRRIGREIGGERRPRRGKRPGERPERGLRRPHAPGAPRFVGEEPRDFVGERGGIVDRLRRVGHRVERRVDVGEVVDMRAVEHRGAEADRLDRVLSAMLDQRAADEGDRRDPVEQPELAEGIGDVDLRPRARAAPPASAAPPSGRAPRARPRCPARARDGGARSR